MPNYPEQKCQMCGKDISNKRIDAKYCDNRCRMRYNRYKEKESVIHDIIDICTRIPHNAEQTPDRSWKMRFKDLKTGEVEYLTSSELALLSKNRIDQLLKQKRMEEALYKTTGTVF